MVLNKYVLVHAFVVMCTVSSVVGVSAYAKNENNPFSHIYNSLASLQQQIDDIQLIPGPQGEKGDKGEKGDAGERGLDGVGGIDKSKIYQKAELFTIPAFVDYFPVSVSCNNTTDTLMNGSYNVGRFVDVYSVVHSYGIGSETDSYYIIAQNNSIDTAHEIRVDINCMSQ